MKKVFLIVLLFPVCNFCYSQTWDEWFKQRKTQIKYLVQQIAAYRVYADYLEKGYAIVRDGTNAISDTKNGDFNLHKGYFTSLQHVSPAIRNFSKVSIIISDQARIIRQFKKLLSFCRASGQFTPSDLQYINSVADNLYQSSEKNIDELTVVITSGKLDMKDDERLERINRLYDDTKEQLTFTFSFCRQATALAQNRLGESFNLELYRKLSQQP